MIFYNLLYEFMFIFKRCRCQRWGKKKDFFDEEKLLSLEKILKTVGVLSRIKILFYLSKSSHCVCDLMSDTGLSQSLLSHHLADLLTLGLVDKKKIGRFTEFFLTGKGKVFVNLLKKYLEKKGGELV